MSNWKPTGWWRAVGTDGSVWAESSNEAEIRRCARDAPFPTVVQRHMRHAVERWEDVPVDHIHKGQL